MSSKTESVIANPASKKLQGPEGFIAEFYDILKELIDSNMWEKNRVKTETTREEEEVSAKSASNQGLIYRICAAVK